MHILISVNSAWNVLNFRRPLIEALLADGHQLTILAPEDACVPALEGLGCRFLNLSMDRKGLNPLKDIQLAFRFIRAFRRECPDLVLSFTIKNNIFGAFAAKWLGLRFVPTVTGLGTAFLSGGPLQKIAEGLYKRAFGGLDLVVFQNGDDRELFVTKGLVDAASTAVFPGSGLDTAAFAPCPLPSRDDGFVFLMIARLLRDKGVREYAAAAQLVKQAFPSARFQLLGDIAARNRSAVEPQEVESWVAQGDVEYLGHVDDVRPFITGAHCVVLPSYREGCPRCLIEGAAMGRPLIATDVPGCREVVQQGKTGLMCRARDFNSLADTFKEMLNMSDSALQQMGDLARQDSVARFDARTVNAKYRAAVQSVRL